MAHDTKAILCPYCGLMQPQASSDDSGTGQRCASCTGLFDPLSRKATQISMGPWYIRDKANPFRPGCCFEVLKRQIEAGKLKPTTVLRGPTTRQFWAIARNVPGIGHLLGYCPRCGAKVKKTDVACSECAEPFIEPDERNELGLMYPTKRAAETAYKQLEKEVDDSGAGKHPAIRESKSSSRSKHSASAKPADADTPKSDEWQPGLDLFDDVIGQAAATSSSSSSSASGSSQSALTATASLSKPSSESPAHPSASPIKFGSAIDFAPADADSEGESSSLDQHAPPSASMYGGQNRNTQLVVWLLVAVNLLLLPILIGALLYFMGVFDNDEAMTQSSPPASVFNDGFHASPPFAVPPEQAEPLAPASPVIPANIQAAVEEAQRLETDGELTRAITLLQDVKQKTGPNERPADLEAHIRRIQEKIDRSETAEWFGVPIQPR